MSQDNLLASTDREEALSRAYLQAVAAGAGYAVASLDFDRDGIDCESVTIDLPEHNRFDVDALRALMDRSRTGVIR